MPSPPETNSDSLEPAQLLQLVLDTIPQTVFWKDINSVYLGCNRVFATDANLESPDQIVGLTDFDMPWTREEAEFYRACDRRVMERNEPELGIIEPQTNSEGEVFYLETNKVPLQDDTGNVIGILGTYHDITKIKEAEQTLQRAHDLMEQRVKDRTKELRYLAERDTLTHLPNRKFFTSQLENAIAEGAPFGVMFIDIDRFKTVNDSLGHGAGDQLLVQVAKALESSVKNSDTVGRFGGDEFTILLRDICCKQDVINVCQRIQNLLASSVRIDNSRFVVTASIGFLTDFENQYCSAGDVLRDSDIAMYEAKRAGKACHRSFTNEMLARVTEKMNLEQQIRKGLENDEFTNVYQPIVDLKAGRLQGFEALVRWKHKETGLVSPSGFLPLAEETGLIVDIGERVIRSACQQLAKWREDFPALFEDLSVSVNLATIQLLWEEFPVFLDGVLSKYGLEPRHLKIEITESMILEDKANVKRVLDELSARGHTLMLDDFGTGFSSLSYLHQFPIDTLKIDRSFVHLIESNHSGRAIVKTVIGLAELLGMNVVAEGVETEREEATLIELGCQTVQGYRYAKPMSESTASGYLASWVHAAANNSAESEAQGIR